MARQGKSDGGAALRMAVTLISALFHATLFVLLVRTLAPSPIYDDTPAIQVALVAPVRPAHPKHDLAKPAPKDDRTAPSQIGPTRPVPPAPRFDGDAAPLTLDGAAPNGAELAARGRQALRGLRGCDSPQLTREARERCEGEHWDRTAAGPARLNLDPDGRYARNPEPFLSRRPTKGCRARATGDVDVRGENGNTRAGITCVFAF